MTNLLILLLATAGVTLACFPDADLTVDPATLFEQFIVKCNIFYTDAADKQAHFATFQSNLAVIKNLSDPLTAQNITSPYSLNRFADWSQDDFQASYGSYNQALKNLGPGFCDPLYSAPFQGFTRTINYQSVFCMTPVQDQGNCTSDWALFTASNIADNYCLSAGEWCELSYQQVIDCTPATYGCQGGLWITSAAQILVMPGIERSFQYPFTGQKGNCQYQNSLAIHKTILGAIYPARTEDIMRDTIDQRITFVIAVDATNWQFISGTGVIGEGAPQECCRSTQTHYVEVVGYGNNERSTPYWLVKNSWGTGWGDQGLARIIAGKHCYQLTKQFGYFPTKSQKGECTSVGPLPFTPPTPPSGVTVVTNTPQPTVATTQGTTVAGQSCGQQCGKWRLIWQILQSVNANNATCVVSP